MKLQRNVPLKKFTTFKIGGSARYFIEVFNLEDLKEALNFAEKNKLKVFILGGGSNVLVSDKGFDGLVIKNQISGLKIIEKNKTWTIKSGGGLPLSRLIEFSVKNNLTGIEYLAGIPGTLGGAVFGNAGAFDHSVSEVVKEVEILNLKTKKAKKLKKRELNFGYRSSLFQKEKDWIIVNVCLALKKTSSDLKKKISEFLRVRKQKQPLEFPSAGSVFKNVPIEEVKKEILKRENLLVINDFIPAGFLIEKVGLKGFKMGRAMISWRL